ncbi:DUF2550 domain-containing protein [Longispora albida]|uniref:DUF2550 domain-containing protein n=1 Tax=Longispora albida TaxID=203523 RepID=UPI0003729BE6|nr:DUF2550 domain-containing protein [Longispora albida]
MRAVTAIGIGVLTLLCLLAAIYLRRFVITRGGGTIDMTFRLTASVPGRGWSAGFARFAGRELRWYRLFSLSWRPRRVLLRPELVVAAKRQPEGAERVSVPPDSVILRITTPRGPVEIAFAEAALSGFLSWLEAAPPGPVGPRGSATPELPTR